VVQSVEGRRRVCGNRTYGQPDSGPLVVHSCDRIDSEVASVEQPLISNLRTGQRMRFVDWG